jgi:predicted nuclease of predicted toxin-antitoxin system
MKGFLIDENLPARLRFSPRFPVIPLSKIGRNPIDSQLCDFARKHDRVIISKDADFSDRIITNSLPPRVVHLRFGNLRKSEFHALLARVWPKVEVLLKTHKLVNVYVDRLEGMAKCLKPARQRNGQRWPHRHHLTIFRGALLVLSPR